MGFLRKMFRVSEKENKEGGQVNKENIFDFFDIDVKNIPDESFVKADGNENIEGSGVEVYRKNLSSKECGIFDVVEVFVTEEGSKNVFFKSFDCMTIKISFLKKLINDLYLIYGEDSENKGRFNNQDVVDFNSKDFYMLFGRTWTEYPKHKYPVSISRDKHCLEIGIWGVNDI